MIEIRKETTRLVIGAHQRSNDGPIEIHEIVFRVPADLRWFKGHFEGNPVLPAMVQLHEVLLLVQGIWPDLIALRRITRAKFHKRIRPSESLRLLLKRTRGIHKTSFAYLRGNEKCSSGVLEFAPPDGGQE